jgi:glycosyltransferase involved in cell wall biosynthesis
MARAFEVVLAEHYYERRLPHGHKVLNYPQARRGRASLRSAFAPDSHRLLYTGNVTEDRGALQHAAIVQRNSNLEVHLVGRCSRALADRMRLSAGSAGARLFFTGIDEYVPFGRIRDCYEAESWLCGVAIFPPSPHYQEKELTKLFEFMQAGLPIICSDFPVWRTLVADHGVGLCVPPSDTNAIDAAIRWLREHPQRAAEMGKRGQQLVRERFNWETEASRLLALYAEILGRSA